MHFLVELNKSSADISPMEAKRKAALIQTIILTAKHRAELTLTQAQAEKALEGILANVRNEHGKNAEPSYEDIKDYFN